MSGRSPRWFNGFDRLWEPNFADNSWKQVIWCCQNRFIPHTWAVGDQLIMTIDGDDYPIDIIGMNHDNYIDSSGKAPLTFQLHPCYDHAYKIFTTVPTSASWKDSDMRQINLPAIMALMPEEVQTAIRVVEKNTPSSGLTNDKLSARTFVKFEISKVYRFNTHVPLKQGKNHVRANSNHHVTPESNIRLPGSFLELHHTLHDQAPRCD